MDESRKNCAIHEITGSKEDKNVFLGNKIVEYWAKNLFWGVYASFKCFWEIFQQRIIIVFLLFKLSNNLRGIPKCTNSV